MSIMSEGTERQRLKATLQKVRKTIKQVRDRKDRFNEESTRTALINPMLSALGWDLLDIDEVSVEYQHKPKDKPVDYALLLLRSPCLFVEAKALDTNLDDRKWVGQIIAYASMAGVDWCVLTDGNQYRIYNAHASVDVDEKLFRIVCVSEPAEEEVVLDTLELLSKDKMRGKIIDELWKAHFVDRNVQATLADLFEGPSNSLVNWIRKCRPELKPSDIKDSLKRAEIIIDFPASPFDRPEPTRDTAEETVPSPPEPEPPTVGSKLVKVADLISAGLVKAGDRWRAHSHGKEHFAEVNEDGSLLVEGESFGSPSAAGRKATGWGSVDGWHFWRFEDADGTRKKTDDLRKRLRASATSEATLPTDDQVTKKTFSVEGHLAGNPQNQALYEALLRRTKETVGEFSVHANSKHIVFSHGSAFLVISVSKKGLRMGLRLATSQADAHPRLRVQPKGIFEGWGALHVSTAIPGDGGLDEELLALIGQAYVAAV